jgi:hypothetical protein
VFSTRSERTALDDVDTTTGEGTVTLKVLVPAVLNYRVCEIAIELQLLVATACKCSMSPITNPILINSHSYLWQYYNTEREERRRWVDKDWNARIAEYFYVLLGSQRKTLSIVMLFLFVSISPLSLFLFLLVLAHLFSIRSSPSCFRFPTFGSCNSLFHHLLFPFFLFSFLYNFCTSSSWYSCTFCFCFFFFL